MQKMCLYGFNKTLIHSFNYQKIGVEVDGGFTFDIQRPWQREMIIQHGHQRGVAIDATFGTNEKHVIHYVLIHNTCTCDLIH